MDFYTLLSSHYDEIFPLSGACAGFVGARVKEGTRLLDAGCSTGALVRALRGKGIDALGFDLDESMIRLALKNLHEKDAEKGGEIFRQGNLTNISDMYGDGTFQCITCLGNTLIHIPFNYQFQFLSDSASLLGEQGTLILQILNYSNILNEGMLFPEIVTSDYIFRRFYEPGPAEGMLYFNTSLTEKKNGAEYKSSIIHYPLMPETLMAALSMSGYSEWNTYGSYSGDTAGSGQLPLIVEAHL